MADVLSIIASVLAIILGIIAIIPLVKKYLFKMEVPEPETGTTEFRERIPYPSSEPIRHEPDINMLKNLKIRYDINMLKNLDVHKILDSADEIAGKIAKERGVSKEDVTVKEVRTYKQE